MLLSSWLNVTRPLISAGIEPAYSEREGGALVKCGHNRHRAQARAAVLLEAWVLALVRGLVAVRALVFRLPGWRSMAL